MCRWRAGGCVELYLGVMQQQHQQHIAVLCRQCRRINVGDIGSAAWRPVEEQAHGHRRENARKVFSVSVVISLVGTISGKSLKLLPLSVIFLS